jgi:fumarylacetoacetate (FAA) hydrolase
VDLTFDFPALIVPAAKTRRLSAGTIVGSGTVSNRDRSAGICCLGERRMIETIETGQPVTPYLTWSDRIEIEVKDSSGCSVFGRIDQTVVPLGTLAGANSRLDLEAVQ